MVDLEGQTRIQVAQGIVREPGKMQDRIETLKIRQAYIAHVLGISGISAIPSLKVLRPNRSVRAHYFMAGRQQHWY